MMHGRRAFMITGAAAADGGAGGGAAWAAETPIRYPDPNIKVLDPRFQQYVLSNAAIERLAGGCRFTEGPVWFGDGRYLLWSDIPNDRMLKWEEETGAISVFRRPSHCRQRQHPRPPGPPAHVRDGCATAHPHRIRRHDHGARRPLRGQAPDRPQRRRRQADGSIWFSDNGADTRGNYLGHKAPWEFPFRVYRLDPGTGATIAVDDMKRPNGLAFSPDETLLYIVDTPGPGQRTIQVYDVVDQGTKVANRREFCN